MAKTGAVLIGTLLLVVNLCTTPVQAMYYRAFPKRWQCFKDIISSNYVSICPYLMRFN